MEPTKRCQLLLSICAVVLISLIFAIPQADAAFNEDFESYADGQALNEGSNPNGWTAYDEDFTIRFSWFGHRTISGGGNLPAVTDFAVEPGGTPAFFGKQSRGDQTSAAIAPVGGFFNSGMVTWTFNVRYPGATGNSTAIALFDSSSGGFVGIGGIHGGHNINTNEELGGSFANGDGWFADVNGVCPNCVAQFVVELDLDNDTFGAVATLLEGDGWPVGNGTFTGDRQSQVAMHESQTNPVFPLPAGFGFDQILLAYNGNGFTVHDNISVGTDIVAPPPLPDFTWNSADSGAWGDSSNWAPFGGPPGDANKFSHFSHTATFGDAIGSESRTVFTDVGVTVNSVNFANTMGGSPSYNLAATTNALSVLPSLGVTAGAHEFQAPVNLLNNTTVDVASGSTLEFNHRLFLNNNVLTKTGPGEMAVNNILTAGGGTLICGEGLCSGSGTIGGDVNNSGGTISPGNSAGLKTMVPEPSACLLALLGALDIVGCVLRRGRGRVR